MMATATSIRMLETVLAMVAIFAVASCASGAPTATPEPSASNGSAAAPGGGGPIDDELVLIGIQDFAFDDLMVELRGQGYGVGAGADAITSDTDLVVLVVNGRDGPMPATREAIADLVGTTVPRMAIAITEADEQTDAEIHELIAAEASELLASFGISPVDSEYVILFPGEEIASVVDRHLSRPPRNYVPSVPPELPPPATAEVRNFAGVPMTDALQELAEVGLVGEVMADPSFGVVSDCDPLVMDQAPAAGTVLPAGGVVVVLVSAPDSVDPAMAGCLLPELSREEIDARIAALEAQ